MDDLLKLPEILDLLDRRTDSKSKELNWSLLLGWVHGSVLRAAKRLKPNDHHSKARVWFVTDIVNSYLLNNFRPRWK